MQKKRALMFHIMSLQMGGAERVISGLANHFSGIGYRVALVTANKKEANEYPLSPDVERFSLGVEEPGHLYPRQVDEYCVGCFRLRNLCKRYMPTALVTFSLSSNVRGVLATCGLPIKNVISVRGNPAVEYAGWAKGWVAKHILTRADGAVFQTEAARQWFPNALQKKSAVILNPVRDAFFRESRVLPGKNIVAVGRLHPIKNFYLLVDAFAKIADTFPEEDLLIYGQGRLRENLERHIVSLGLVHRVRLMGITHDVPKVLSRAKLFVLSSDSEGLPNALMEAMAIGLPVVSTDCPCGGPRMLIRDGVSGILVPTGDADAMSRAMGRLLADDRIAENMGRMAKVDARMRFDSSTVMKAWEIFVESFV